MPLVPMSAAPSNLAGNGTSIHHAYSPISLCMDPEIDTYAKGEKRHFDVHYRRKYIPLKISSSAVSSPDNPSLLPIISHTHARLFILVNPYPQTCDSNGA